MSPDDVLIFILVFLIVAVPILGLTARLALKPIVDAIVRLRETFADSSGGSTERRMRALEEELRQVRAELQRLAEAEAFHRKLYAPDDEAALPVAADPTPDRSVQRHDEPFRAPSASR